MVAQVVAISLVIAGIRWPRLNPIATVAMYSVVLFAILSAIGYFAKFWRRVDDHVKLRRRREILAIQRRERKLARARGEAVAEEAKVGGR